MSEQRLCGVEGCGRPHKARSMCRTHYKAWRKDHPVLDPATVDPAPTRSIVISLINEFTTASISKASGVSEGTIRRITSGARPTVSVRSAEAIASMDRGLLVPIIHPRAVSRTCTVGDCRRPYQARNMCSTHYSRWRSGIPLDQPRGVRRHLAPQRLCDIEGCASDANTSDTTHATYADGQRQEAAAVRPLVPLPRTTCPRGCGRLWHDLEAVASPIPELPWPACPGSTITVSDSERVSA